MHIYFLNISNASILLLNNLATRNIPYFVLEIFVLDLWGRLLLLSYEFKRTTKLNMLMTCKPRSLKHGEQQDDKMTVVPLVLTSHATVDLMCALI